MRVTIVRPSGRSGGNDVIDVYARHLAAHGHEVVMVSPASAAPTRTRRWLTAVRSSTLIRRAEGGVEYRVLGRARAVVEDDVPDADVVVATWWETAEWVSRYSASKGRKVHFVQGHEVYPWLPQQRTRDAYRLPMRRIVVSKWLADILATDYGDTSADVVPNAVDHTRFTAPARTRQVAPTVGLLSSATPFKGFSQAIELLQSLREQFPTLKVLSFGLDVPSAGLPDFVLFEKDPAVGRIRDIYASCDVWLSASTSEGFNLPVVEALACGTPVVCFATGWPVEGVRSGWNGACVPVGDWPSLRQELAHILASAEGEWMSLSLQAADSVADMSWQRSATAFEGALLRVARPA